MELGFHGWLPGLTMTQLPASLPLAVVFSFGVLTVLKGPGLYGWQQSLTMTQLPILPYLSINGPP